MKEDEPGARDAFYPAHKREAKFEKHARTRTQRVERFIDEKAQRDMGLYWRVVAIVFAVFLAAIAVYFVIRQL